MIETQMIPQMAGVRQSLNHALEEATAARQEAKEARSAVAAEQAKVAESEREKMDLFRQIADLQRVLGDEKARASKLEAKLEMMETQVIPQTAEEMGAKLKRKGIVKHARNGLFPLTALGCRQKRELRPPGDQTP